MSNLVCVIIVTLPIICVSTGKCLEGENCSYNCSINCLPFKKGRSPCNETSGECHEGCFPGFFGTTCNLPCSPNCPNRICAVHKGHCTHDCNPNNCGDLCDKNCPSGDETNCTETGLDGNIKSTRGLEEYFPGIHGKTGIGIGIAVGIVATLAVILVTWNSIKFIKRKRKANNRVISIILPINLATEGCPTCLDGECKVTRECTKGCIIGFADKYCKHNCQRGCKDANCELDKNTGKMICQSGCEDGYCGQQCKAPCDDGCLNCDYGTCTCPRCSGDKCQHSCLDGCSLCDKGQCLFCRDGFHGRNCSQICGSKCTRCEQETGKCIKCQQGFHGDSCDQVSTDKTIESNTSVPGAPDGDTACVVVIVILIAVILVLVLGFSSCAYMNGWNQAFGWCRHGISNDQHQQNKSAEEDTVLDVRV